MLYRFTIFISNYISGGKTECYYSSMASCNKFIHCYNNSAHEKLCPDGLVWNDYQGKDECGWPSEVNCGARPITGKVDSVDFIYEAHEA